MGWCVECGGGASRGDEKEDSRIVEGEEQLAVFHSGMSCWFNLHVGDIEEICLEN